MKYSSIMNIAKKLFGIENNPANKEYWCKQYYQIANRIAFQQKLITIARKEKVNYACQYQRSDTFRTTFPIFKI